MSTITTYSSPIPCWPATAQPIGQSTCKLFAVTVVVVRVVVAALMAHSDFNWDSIHDSLPSYVLTHDRIGLLTVDAAAATAATTKHSDVVCCAGQSLCLLVKLVIPAAIMVAVQHNVVCSILEHRSNPFEGQLAG